MNKIEKINDTHSFDLIKKQIHEANLRVNFAKGSKSIREYPEFNFLMKKYED